MDYENTFYFRISIIDLGVTMSKKPPRCGPQIFVRRAKREKKEEKKEGSSH